MVTRPTADQLKAWRELCERVNTHGKYPFAENDFNNAAREAVPALLDEVERYKRADEWCEEVRKADEKLYADYLCLRAELDRLRRENEAMERINNAARKMRNWHGVVGFGIPSDEYHEFYSALAALDKLRKGQG